MAIDDPAKRSRANSVQGFASSAPSKEWTAQLKDLHTTIQINKDVIKGLIEAQQASNANETNQALAQAL